MLLSESSVSHSGNFKDCWLQITITIMNNEKVWNIARITKMCQRHEMSKCCWKNNGGDRPAQQRVATNFSLKTKTAGYENNYGKTIKWDMPVYFKIEVFKITALWPSRSHYCITKFLILSHIRQNSITPYFHKITHSFIVWFSNVVHTKK